MTSLAYMLAALFAMIPSPFLFKDPMRLPLRGAAIAIVLLVDELFVLFCLSKSVCDCHNYISFKLYIRLIVVGISTRLN